MVNPALQAVVNGEDVFVQMHEVSTAFLTEEVIEVLPEKMKLVLQVCDMDFQQQLESLKLVAEGHLRGRMALVLCDSCYNIPREKNISNLDHDSFSLEYMTDFVRFLNDVLWPCGQGHIFFSALQFKHGIKS